MTGGGNSITDSAAPSIHAVGGSLGSALALLLLYPLERARVELQTMTASNNNSNDNNEIITTTTVASGETSMNDTTEPLLTQERLEPRASRGGGAVAVVMRRDEKGHRKNTAVKGSMSEESWESCLKPEDSSSEDDELSLAKRAAASSREQQKLTRQKVGLLSCLLELHQRRQLYQGVTPVVTTMAVSNFVFFYMHSFLKQLLVPGGDNPRKLRLSLLASTMAGLSNVLLTNPLWVANLRIVTSDTNNDNSNNKNSNSNNSSLWQEMQQIVKAEGWPHLWNGSWASLLLVSNPVIQFFTYEQLKNRLLLLRNQKHTGNLNPLEAFILGALAKAISTVLTYPLQLTQTVMRVQKQEQQEGESSSSYYPKSQPATQQHYKGTLDCLIKIYKKKGVEGWFAGMRTKLLQTVLTAAFTFLTYEQIIKALMAVHRALTVRDIRSGRLPRANAPVP